MFFILLKSENDIHSRLYGYTISFLDPGKV
jgi:hypothetical protein